MKKILFFTNCQKILAFLMQHLDENFYDLEISKRAGISRAGSNFALRDLARAGLVQRSKKGRMVFYKVLPDNIIIKYLKIVHNIAFINSLVQQLKSCSLRIILFGSSASGENSDAGDMDLFILTREKEKVKNIIFNDKQREKIQYVSMTPNEYVKLKISNPVFYNEVEKGIELWKTK